MIPVRTWYVIGITLSLSAAISAEEPKPAQQNPASAITLSDALGLALRQSPELEAYSWEIRAADAREVQARLRPNPVVSVEVEDWRLTPGAAPRSRAQALTLNAGAAPAVAFERERGSGEPAGIDNAEISIGIAQTFELGGKRNKRGDLAQRGADVARWDYRVARAHILARAAQAFYHVLATQEEVGVRERLVELAGDVRDTVAARVEAGKVSPLQENRADLELASAEIALEEVRQRLKGARARLAATWGAADPRFDHAAGQWHEPEGLPELTHLRQRIEENPELGRWAAEMARRDAAFTLARARRIPDLEVGFRVATRGRESGNSRGLGIGPGSITFRESDSSFESGRDYAFELGASIALPIFDRNQGRIRETEHLIAKGDAERRATRAEIVAALNAAYHAAAAAHQTQHTLQKSMLPKAETTLEKTQRGYEQGKFGLLDVLDAERTVIDLQLRYFGALTAYHENYVELERLTGMRIGEAAGEHGVVEEENDEE